MNNDAIDLTEAFLRKVKGMKKETNGKYPLSDTYKRSVLKDALSLLHAGQEKQSILNWIEACTGTPEERAVYNIKEYLTLKVKGFTVIQPQVSYQKTNECIVPGQFYFHPELQLTSPPMRFLFDSETMSVVETTSEPFFLEIKDSYTAEDVLDYFQKETGIELLRPQRYVKQILQMVEDHGLDLVLYLFDAGPGFCQEEGLPLPTVPVFYEEFLPRAKEMYERRTNDSKEANLDHVHRRTITPTDA